MYENEYIFDNRNGIEISKNAYSDTIPSMIYKRYVFQTLSSSNTNVNYN